MGDVSAPLQQRTSLEALSLLRMFATLADVMKVVPAFQALPRLNSYMSYQLDSYQNASHCALASTSPRHGRDAGQLQRCVTGPLHCSLSQSRYAYRSYLRSQEVGSQHVFVRMASRGARVAVCKTIALVGTARKVFSSVNHHTIHQLHKNVM